MRKVKIIIAFLLGCCAGVIAVAICYDRINKTNPIFWQFKLFDLLSLIIYAVIGIYVAYHLRNRFSDRQIKKNLFLGIATDAEKLFEQKLLDFNSFMKAIPRKPDERIKVTLELKKISNKIHILEEHKNEFNEGISNLVDKIRHDYNEIKQTITGDEFVTPKSFSEENINHVFKCTFNIILYLDELKLSIFD